MVEDQGDNGIASARRNGYIQQLHRLAADMENNVLEKISNLASLPENKDYLLVIREYKIQAAKIIFEAYQYGEIHGDGLLCSILGYWNKIPYPQYPEWCYVQGFDSVCWQWYGDRFEDRIKKAGELGAYAHVIRLLISELEKNNID